MGFELNQAEVAQDLHGAADITLFKLQAIREIVDAKRAGRELAEDSV